MGKLFDSLFVFTAKSCKQNYEFDLFYYIGVSFNLIKVVAIVLEDEPIPSLSKKEQVKGAWDDEDVDENDVKDSWEDEDESAPVHYYLF